MEIDAPQNDAPKIVQELEAVGIAPGVAYSAENVRIAQGASEMLKSDDVVRAIEEDAAARDKLAGELSEKAKELAKLQGEASVLRLDLDLGEAFVEEAGKQIESDHELIESATRELAKLREEHQRTLEAIETERQSSHMEADEERRTKKQELARTVMARPEATQRQAIREDLALVGRLTEVMSNSDLTGALDRLQSEMGAGTGVASAVESLGRKAEQAVGQRDELAAVTIEERKKYDEEAEGKKLDADRRAESKKKEAEEEFARGSETIQARITLYEKRLKDHTTLQSEHIQRVDKLSTDISLTEERAKSLESQIATGQKEVVSLDRSISAQTELVGKLARAVEDNSERLADRGREVIEMTAEAVAGLRKQFESQIAERRNEVELAAHQARNEVQAQKDRLKSRIEEVKAKADAEFDRRLVGTGLYEIGADGDIVKTEVKGREKIKADFTRQGEVGAAIGEHDRLMGFLSNAEGRSEERRLRRLEDVVKERDTRLQAIEDQVAPEVMKFEAASSSLDAILRVLPPQEPATPVEEKRKWYGEPLKAVGKLLGRLWKGKK